MTGPVRDYEAGEQGLSEKVVDVRRVAKVVKGGRHLTFSVMVVVGDGRGRVGIGLGKGPAVPDAVRKGVAIARKEMVTVSMKGSTILNPVNVKFGATRILMKPAAPGAGIIAGGAARAVMEMAGVKDVVAKVLGSRNPINVVKAAMAGLLELESTAPAPVPAASRPMGEQRLEPAAVRAPTAPTFVRSADDIVDEEEEEGDSDEELKGEEDEGDG